MSLKDVFRPRWKHTNPEIRAVAVSKITKPNVLKQIISDESDLRVQTAAAQQLSESHAGFLLDPDLPETIRVIGAGRVTDLEYLAEVLIQEVSSDVFGTGLARIGDQNILRRVFMNLNKHAFRKQMIDRIQDQALLAEIALTDSNIEIRGLALEKIKDQQVSSIHCTDNEHPELRIIAATNLEIMDVLIDIVQSDFNSDVRMAALTKIDDPEVLTLVAKGDRNPGIAKSAAEKLSHSKHIEKLVRSGLRS